MKPIKLICGLTGKTYNAVVCNRLEMPKSAAFHDTLYWTDGGNTSQDIYRTPSGKFYAKFPYKD